MKALQWLLCAVTILLLTTRSTNAQKHFYNPIDKSLQTIASPMPAVGDFDQDGLNDILLTNNLVLLPFAGELYLTNDVGGRRAEETIAPFTNIFRSPMFLAPMHLNDDALLDIIAVSSDSVVYKLYNQGLRSSPRFKVAGPTWELKQKIPSPFINFRSIRWSLIDINYDGKKDLIFTSYSQEILDPSNFSGLVAICSPNYSEEIVLSPGKLKDFHSFTRDGKVHFLSHFGEEEFAETRVGKHSIYTSFWKMTSKIEEFCLLDINNDNYKDLVYFTKNNILIRLNGEKSFVAKTLNIPFAGEDKLVKDSMVLDFDLDGKEDLVLLYENILTGENFMSLYKNHEETLVLEESYQIKGDLFGNRKDNLGMSFLSKGDVNSDGSIDIILCPISGSISPIRIQVFVNKHKKKDGLFGFGTPKVNPPDIYQIKNFILGKESYIGVRGAKPNSIAVLHIGLFVRDHTGWIPNLDVRVFPSYVTLFREVDKQGKALARFRIPNVRTLVGEKYFFQWFTEGEKQPLFCTKALGATVLSY